MKGSPQVTQDELGEYFAKYGPIDRVDVMYKGGPKPFAFASLWRRLLSPAIVRFVFDLY